MIQVSEYLTNKTIFDDDLSSYDFLTSDIITALNAVFGIKYNKMYLIDDSETAIHMAVNNIIMLNSVKYNDIFVSMNLDPLEEYSETKTNTGTQTDADTGTQTDADTGTQTDVLTPSVVSTVTTKKNTANNATLRNIDQVESSSTGTDNKTRTDNLTHTRTDNLTHTRTDNLTEVREGYNNVFDNVEKLFHFANMELYDMILIDVMKSICYPIYNINDLAF